MKEYYKRLGRFNISSMDSVIYDKILRRKLESSERQRRFETRGICWKIIEKMFKRRLDDS